MLPSGLFKYQATKPVFFFEKYQLIMYYYVLRNISYSSKWGMIDVWSSQSPVYSCGDEGWEQDEKEQ